MARGIKVVEHRPPGQSSGIGIAMRKGGPMARSHGIAWGVMAVLIVGGALAGQQLITHYSGGNRIVMRDWIKLVNTVMCGAQLVGLAWLATTSKYAGGLFVGQIFAAGAVIAGLQLALPYLYGQGPWVYEETIVTVQRHLTFAPSVLRDLGGALAAFALVKRGNMVQWGAVLAFLISAGGVAVVWSNTPYAIIARVHGSPHHLVWVAVGLVGAVMLGWGYTRRETRGGDWAR